MFDVKQSEQTPLDALLLRITGKILFVFLCLRIVYRHIETLPLNKRKVYLHSLTICTLWL